MRRTHPVLPFDINRALNYWAKSYEPHSRDLLWLHMCAAEPLAAILPPPAGSQPFAESGEVLGMSQRRSSRREGTWLLSFSCWQLLSPPAGVTTRSPRKAA